ncbi:MAG: glycerophosphodiester phosphodiesterase [Acidimicrobiia bacterium]
MPFDRPARHPFLDHPGPIPFAHRGGAGDWPENTMPAFAGAIALGYRYVETDVQVTSDGVLVAFHDDDLSRTCGRPGHISMLPWSEVATARVDGKEPIPLFEDLLAAFPECRVNVDCKTDAAVEPLIASLQRTNSLDRVCVGSFKHHRLVRLRSALGPGLCSSMSPLEVVRWRVGLPSSAALVAQVPVRQGIVPVVTRRTVALAHRHGIDVHVWTIDEPAEMLRLLELHVDGIMTDRPAVLKQVMSQRGEWA